MNRNDQFVSCLGPTMEQFVELKVSVGLKFESERWVLLHFDRFLSGKAKGAEEFDAECFTAWCQTLDHLHSGTRRRRMQIVHSFCLYRRRTDPSCFLPDSAQFPLPSPGFRPYIFTETEILLLLDAAGNLGPSSNSPLRREVYRLGLTLLYTTGLRRGELLRLTLGDYSPTEQTLLVRESKCHRSRRVASAGVREMTETAA